MSDGTSVFELDYLITDARGGKISADRMLSTPGVSPAHLTECVRLAQLWPPLPSQRSEAMPSSIGVFRADSVAYFLVKAQQGSDNAPHFQFVFMPSAPLNQLAGHVRWFDSFARIPIPESEVVRTGLPRLKFEGLTSIDTDGQVEDFLTLLSFCKNRTQVVKGLTAALVQMMGIGIINAPSSLNDRLTFVQGLLTMLPAPVRGTITFATNVIDPLRANAQIKFLASPNQRPARHLIFDWATGKLMNDPPEDIYSNFAMSQFRFDPSAAVEQVRHLERTAAWRTARKDDLTSALAWAARRASLDSALANDQPGDPKMVAEVLADDLSLTDELRVLYARHLLKFALSMDDPAQTDAVGIASTRSNAVATAVTVDLQTVVADPARAQSVQRVIARWTSHVPDFDLNDPRWVALLSAAILVRAKPVLEAGDPTAIKALLESYLDIPPTLRIERAMAQVIGAARKVAYTDEGVARALILNAAAFLPTGGLQRLFVDPALVSQMPAALREVLAMLLSNSPARDPRISLPATPVPAILVRAGESCGAQYRAILLARLVELALAAQRIDLVDANALQGLMESGTLVHTTRFDVLCQQLIEDLSRLNTLKSMDKRTLQYLIGLSLVRDRYPQAAAQLEFYQNTLYKGRNADDLYRLVEQTFRETRLRPAQFSAAFDAMQTFDLRPLLLANAYLGVLEQYEWSSQVSFAVQSLTAMLTSDPNLVQIIDSEAVLHLIRANAEQHNTIHTLRLAAALTNRAISAGEPGLTWIGQIYQTTNWGPEVSASAIELLCSYVRHAPVEQAKTLLERSPQQYGLGITNALNAVYRLRLITNGGDLAAFSAQISTSAALLRDVAVAYHNTQTTPSLQTLRRMIDAMSSSLAETERQKLASTLLQVVDQCARLANLRTRDPAQAGRLSQAFIPPTSGLDALRWIGGYCAKGRVLPLELDHTTQSSVYANRSLDVLLRDTLELNRLLDQLYSAFPAGMPALDNASMQSEFETLVKHLPAVSQRTTVVKLAEDAQALALLVILIGDQRNERATSPNKDTKSLGPSKIAPRVASEALTWTGAYLRSQGS